MKKKPSFTEINTYDLFSESNKKMPVTHGDFNSDQISDLLLATPEKGEILFLMGKSDGTYESQLVFLPLWAYQNWTLFVQKMKKTKRF